MKTIALLITFALTLGLGFLAYADTPAQSAYQDTAVAADDSQAYQGAICEVAADESLDESAMELELAMAEGENLGEMATQTCQRCSSHSQCDSICGGDGGVCLRALGACGLWSDKICVCI